MMDEYIDMGYGPAPRQPRRWGASVWFWVGVVIGMALVYGIANAAQLNDCSQTVGASAAAVVFPAAGATGPRLPQTYLEICDAHSTNTLGVNSSPGGTASIGAAGTVTLQPGGCLWWTTPAPVPSALSIIGSGASTTTYCQYQ